MHCLIVILFPSKLVIKAIYLCRSPICQQAKCQFAMPTQECGSRELAPRASMEYALGKLYNGPHKY